MAGDMVSPPAPEAKASTPQHRFTETDTERQLLIDLPMLQSLEGVELEIGQTVVRLCLPGSTAMSITLPDDISSRSETHVGVANFSRKRQQLTISWQLAELARLASPSKQCEITEESKNASERRVMELGQLGSPSKRREGTVESESDLERRVLNTFRMTDEMKQAQATVNQLCQNYIEADHVTTPNVTEEDISKRFRQLDIPQDPVSISSYIQDLVKNVVEDGVHTSCPQMIGHMTSALPTHIPVLAKLVAAMNQNVVKTETAKTTTFLEREAMGQLHKLIFDLPSAFYELHVQSAASMLGLFTSGGTLANTSALWVARNRSLPASEDGSFRGVEYEGLIRAMNHHGYKDSIILGSALMHYSLDKATDVLGIGVNALVKIPVDRNYRVDIKQMEEKILWAQKNRVLIIALVGICGTTETGAIDSLKEMSQLANKYGIHFHVDAAWGGPVIFSEKHRFKAAGIELADSVTLDAHKQMWLPMGAGMVFFKDPAAVQAVRKSANYIIRKESHDLGKFTIDGSRAANAIFLHSNLQLFGRKGFEVLFDQTVRIARYMARRIKQSTNFELLVKPMTNILLYRWVPFSLRSKYYQFQLTNEDNDVIDEVNRKLQDIQKLQGKTFVSRTTISCPLYANKPVVGLRVVIGNPLTTEADIDAVLEHQNEIINSGALTDDFDHASPQAIIERRNLGMDAPDMAKAEVDVTLDYWTRMWDSMSDAEKYIYSNSMEVFFDSLITPDCLVTDPSLPPDEALRAGVARVLEDRARHGLEEQARLDDAAKALTRA